MPVTGKSMNVSLGNYRAECTCISPANFKPNQLLSRIRGLAARYWRDGRFRGQTVERPAV